MARSDLLINLVRASVSGDRNAVRAVVETIIAEEKGKQHMVLADRGQSLVKFFKLVYFRNCC